MCVVIAIATALPGITAGAFANVGPTGCITPAQVGYGYDPPSTSTTPTPQLRATALAVRAGNVSVPGSSASSISSRRAAEDVGLASRGLRPLAGTRIRPDGIPEGWRVRPTKGDGGTWYYDPADKGNAIRVMQGDPKSPFPNSQGPYVRWQRNGQPLDAAGNVLPSKFSPDAHIPLSQFKFRPEVFG
jgi:hypothetical protein